ncbi:type II toxin-antitoxin system prevent-host-death family antitoxin [Actinotignum urinale]|uniref:Antitoxin n=1 Tax=Actinotignum urinale TaxID=190146 RepID=A0AAW9HYI1_9ACTO|nr:type II toxin-antitoxin system prevent-host-death family antitoxin [Actinotignum urinale]MDY5128562.1 type II toxin-antitoxin system prevent-host-death family antitoxin [Actinotignum urinale]MDY5132603.1 type II toxin-antitoxin system prevent-host-death family antitoxin [Actinotignum urinale]MDY5151306.1 type II toxin-antitoxin system prevent-host-death family antitoxin [Actinotignum urinale]MDY5155074.1 type II toxin-antitoxin system prevent-host-death family antitoxin [Actinotignum urinale
MSEVGIRVLKQNASAVIRRVEAGETVDVTDRGRKVARIVPFTSSTLEMLAEEGRIRLPLRDVQDLPFPVAGEGSLSQVLEKMRDDERF